MKFGLDRLLEDPTLRAPLKGRRVALLAHPASVTRDLTHALDALTACVTGHGSRAHHSMERATSTREKHSIWSPTRTSW